MYRALVSFTTETMQVAMGEILELEDQELINDLIQAEYIEEYDSSLEIIENGIYDVEDYLTADVDVPTGVDTSDATAVASDLLKNKTAYSKGQKLTGTLEPINTSDATATASDILKDKTAYADGVKLTGTLEVGGSFEITDASYLFYQKARLLQVNDYIPLIKNPTKMENMFNQCNDNSFTQINLESINISQVTSLSNIFRNAEQLVTINVSNWDTSNVIDFSNAFYYCRFLQNLDVSGWDFSKAQYRSGLFSSCYSLSNNSLKSILVACKTMTSAAGSLTLRGIGLTSDQATTCTGFDEWQDLVALGWTTGY